MNVGLLEAGVVEPRGSEEQQLRSYWADLEREIRDCRREKPEGLSACCNCIFSLAPEWPRKTHECACGDTGSHKPASLAVVAVSNRTGSLW